MRVIEELSRYAASRINVVRGDCWRNAWIAVTSLPELNGGLYVEGWIASRKFSLLGEHAWVEVEEGIVDLGIWRAPISYFPVLRLTVTEVLQKLLPGGAYTPDCSSVQMDDVARRLPLAMYSSDYKQIVERVREEALAWRRGGDESQVR